MEFQFKKSRKIILTAVIAIIAIAGILVAWNKFASTTTIALVNFQSHSVSNIILSNKDRFIQFEEVSLEELDKLENYDFVLGNGMGLKIDASQRKLIRQIAKNTPVYFKSVTNPQNNFKSLSKKHLKAVEAYFESGRKENYQNFARYVRAEIDGKKLFVTAPQPPKAAIEDVYFHIAENTVFKDLQSYENYLKKNNLYLENAPKVAMIAGIHDPFSGDKSYLDSIISAFQKSGVNIYPIASFSKRIQFLSEVNPDAVVYFPHGRLEMIEPDRTVDWLKKHNIPFFTPLTVSQLKSEWKESPFGLVGGYMGQVIVMPELDGALSPFVVIAMEKRKDGLFTYQAIPERLNKFTQIVNNHLNLKKKENAAKKVAIYFFKGEGDHTLNAQGMEALPSLYNLLKRMQQEGYNVNGLPATLDGFKKIIASDAKVITPNATGSFQDFVANGHPTLIPADEYNSWLKKHLSNSNYSKVVKKYGAAPGSLMHVQKNRKSFLAISKIQFGNIALLPQQLAAIGDDDFKILHGVKEPPTHAYIGSYLWSQEAFKADAMMHFGTHGSLEFTPFKQVALDSDDWAEILVGTIPHFYYYTIGNVGESMMAKRRSYAATISYLTPAFVESDMRNYFRGLQDKIRYYYKAKEHEKNEISIAVKKATVELGIHRPLRLDSVLTKPYTAQEIEKIENFAEEVATEKINGEFYIAGEPYKQEKINSTVMAMSVDPIAYSLANLDKLRGKITDQQIKNRSFFNEHYLQPSKKIVNELLVGKEVSNQLVCAVTNVSTQELDKALEIATPSNGLSPFVLKMMKKSSKKGSGKPQGKKPDFVGNHGKPVPNGAKKPTSIPAHAHGAKGKKPDFLSKGKPEYSKEEREKARVIFEIYRTITNVINYKMALIQSPELEFKAILNGLAGGYIEPSSGGDAVANPKAVPTGKNLYSINAESTPSELAWDRGVELAKKTIEDYQAKHGRYPRKIAYTFWSSEFVETEGVSIAQALYLLGVEPVRDPFGRVSDVRLIPSEELGRPRIDIVVQTSGQFRDLAASRLFLLTKAIELAANAPAGKFQNMVKEGTLDVEKKLVKQGVSPKQAREMANNRIFGGLQGRYDTGIQDLIKSGDKWETQQQIAEQYMHNMGAVYGHEKDWAKFQEGMFKAALNNADVVIQPRQNNTWGALSLDHVFEFMGGMNVAIKSVTGKEPEAYLADYRNHNNMRMQELKESIGVEVRSTIFNPKFIQEMMKGQASSAGQITEIVTNTFGWEATRPEVIDDELWDEIYATYVEDAHQLGVKEFFKSQNPAALQEITAVMLESARKGMWKASSDKINKMMQLHIELVKEFGAQPNGFSGENEKLHQYIAQNAPSNLANDYKKQLHKMQSGDVAAGEEKAGKVLKEEKLTPENTSEKSNLNGVYVVVAIGLLFVGLVLYLQRKRKNN